MGGEWELGAELGREEGGETGCKTKMIIIIKRLNKTNKYYIIYNIYACNI